MKNMCAPTKGKYEGSNSRTLVEKVTDNWTYTEAAIVERLDCLWGLVGGNCRTSIVLWPLAALVKQLHKWDESDAEDQRIGVLEYLYQCYCVRAVVKHLTESEWRIAAALWEEHFWYAVGQYRGCTPETGRKQLETKLEFVSVDLDEFAGLIEQRQRSRHYSQSWVVQLRG